jgi:PTS system nitrogen regulatory IIA component
MDISDILTSDAVRVSATVSSKKRLFQELGDLAWQAYGLNASVASDALLERENLGPTGVGHGVALPHARLGEVDKVRGLFIRLERGLDFDAVDRQPVDLVFALFAPEDAGVEHLKALALVSRTMRNGQLVAKLRANADPAAIHAILTAGMSVQAA